MKDTRKTKAQLIDELEQLRQQNAQLTEALKQQHKLPPDHPSNHLADYHANPVNQDTPTDQQLPKSADNPLLSLSNLTPTSSVGVTPVQEIIQAIFQASPNLYFYLQSDGLILDHIAQTSGQLYGSPNACIGRFFSDFLPEYLHTRFAERLKHALDNQTAAQFTYRQIFLGKEHVLQATVTPVADREIVMVIQDISGRVHMEQNLKNSYAFLEGVIENLPFAVFVKDREGRYLILNRMAQALLNPYHAYAIGQRDVDVLPVDYYHHLKVLEQQIIQTRQMVQSEEMLNSDGNLQAFIVSRFPIYNYKQDIIAFGSIYINISQHKQTEKRLETLYTISQQLNSVTNENELFSILAQPAIDAEAHAVGLYYFQTGEASTPLEATLVASWRHDNQADGWPSEFSLADCSLAQVWLSTPHEPLIIADIRHDHRLDQQAKALLTRFDCISQVVLPLTQVDSWLGVLCFFWSEPRLFDAQELSIYSALMNLASSTVAKRQAYLAEQQTRQQNELLYRISRDLNAATSNHELLMAISHLAINHGASQIGLWYIEVNGVTKQPQLAQLQAKYQVEALPKFELPVGARFELSYLVNKKSWWFERPDCPDFISDVATEPRLSERQRTRLLRWSVKAMVMMPLWQRGSWVGLINFWWSESRQFTKHEMAIYTRLVGVTTVAVENQRIMDNLEQMVADRTQALQQSQTKSERLYQLSRKLNIVYDEAQLLQVISQEAVRHGAIFADLNYVDTDNHGAPEGIRTVAVWTDPPTNSELPARTISSQMKFSQFPLGVHLAAEPTQLLLIPNIQTDQRLNADAQSFFFKLGFEATVIIPLTRSNQWIAFITLGWSTPHQFTLFETDTYRALMTLAAPEVENRRLVEDLEQIVEARTHRLKVIAHLSGRLSSILEFNQLLQVLVEQVKEQFDYYQVRVYIFDEIGKCLILRSSIGDETDSSATDTDTICLEDANSMVAQAARTQQLAVFHATEFETDSTVKPDSDHETNIYCGMSVPIMLEGQVVGVLGVQSNRFGGLDESDSSLLQFLANQVTTALTNAKLFEQVQQRAIELSQEIQERKQYAIALQASEKRYQTLSEASPVGIFYTDGQAEGVYFNEKWCELAQMSAEEAMGPGWLKAVHPQDVVKVNQAWMRIHREKSGFELEYRFLRPDNSTVWVFGQTTAAIDDTTKNILGYVGTVTDITERRQALHDLQKAKEMAEAASLAKSEFLANISHELRTPLNGILGYAQILYQDTTLGHFQRDGIQVIYQSGEHLLMLINDILDLSRIEAGHLEVYKAEFYLFDFLKNIANMMRLPVEERNLWFTLDISPELPIVVYGDQKRLRQVLINLLGNAVKFTEQGEITFQVKPLNDKIQFKVQDTGVGIEAEKLNEIFEPFRQASAGRDVDGTGLGLSISKRLVAIMGGELYVESTVGQGSCFWFELALPQVDNFQTIRFTQMEQITGYNSETTYRILVVDDKANNRAVLVNLLKPIGFEMYEATNGQEAVALTREFKPHLIFMDLSMPVMNGIEATRQIRQAGIVEDLVIIAVSASAFGQEHTKSLEAGCNEFMIKPFQMEEIFKHLENYLEVVWQSDNSYQKDADKTHIKDEDELPLKPLPPTEIQALFELALKGDIKRIRQRAKILLEGDSEYKPFAEQLDQLAKRFQVKQLQIMLESYLKQ